jgi:hypothetical protein
VEAAWIVPSVVLTVGAAAAAVLLRRIAVAAQELAQSGRRLRRVEDALIPVRVETGRTREALGRYPRR